MSKLLLNTIQELLNKLGLLSSRPDNTSTKDKIWQTNNKIVILVNRQVIFIAESYKSVLLTLGYDVSIIGEEQEQYGENLYIVFCPQMYKHMPANYIAVQLEQSVNEKWFNKAYLRKLNKAIAVFDYSLDNLRFLALKGIPVHKLKYMPISLSKDMYQKQSFTMDKKWDVAFYGSMGAERRKKILSELGKVYSIRVITDMYGDALYKELKAAKIVINVHYYEDALLETARLCECLSVTDSIIISEDTMNAGEYGELCNLVDFVDCGNVNATIEKIKFYLGSPKEYRNKQMMISNYIINYNHNVLDYNLRRFFKHNQVDTVHGIEV